MTTTGIVLAGGRSSRFSGERDPGGGASKLDADLGGRTVLDRAIDAIAAVCDAVIVVGLATGDRPDVRYVPDRAPFEGPLAGLAIGLQAAGGEIAVVIGGDMPLVSPAVLRLLIARLDRVTSAAVLEDEAGPRPLPMAGHREPVAAAATSGLRAGERSLRALLERLDTVAIPPAAWRELDPDGDALLDIDTPADLEHERARLATR